MIDQIFGFVGLDGIKADMLTAMGGVIALFLMVLGVKVIVGIIRSSDGADRGVHQETEEEYNESWVTGWRSKYDRNDVEGRK